MNQNRLQDRIHSCDLILTPFDNERLLNLCGQFDEHLRYIERSLGIEINNRGNVFQIIGSRASVDLARELIYHLYSETGNGHMLTPARVQLSLQESSQAQQLSAEAEVAENILPLQRIKVKPRTASQQQYVEGIETHEVSFGIGPAGTGKTYLAVACAVAAFEQKRVKRILLVRPAVEAGERLGFLPGDLAQKIDPYLRPLYDALYEMLGFERVAKLLERGVIEVAPLAYMRGRTLNDAFVILDESQNTTVEQMKMFLTRIGFGSRVVITGDITQIDLPRGTKSGLRHVISVLKDVDSIGFTFFQSQDVVRHPVVQEIVQAYERHTDEVDK